MVTLSTQRDFRGAQNLPFCYWCGRDFLPTDERNRDHLPPKSLFAVDDRTPCLWLPAHAHCNGSHSEIDQKVAQLISVKWGKTTTSRDLQLKFKVLRPGRAAVINLNIEDVVLRWVRGFHAVLYREPLPDEPCLCTIVTPFHRAWLWTGVTRIDPMLPEHLFFVNVIKGQRALDNLDRISANNGKLAYECVWMQADDGRWLCVFALNVYDWKDLGPTNGQPGRGCVGAYLLPTGSPETATRERIPPHMTANLDRLDPFAP